MPGDKQWRPPLHRRCRALIPEYFLRDRAEAARRLEMNRVSAVPLGPGHEITQAAILAPPAQKEIELLALPQNPRQRSAMQREEHLLPPPQPPLGEPRQGLQRQTENQASSESLGDRAEETIERLGDASGRDAVDDVVAKVADEQTTSRIEPTSRDLVPRPALFERGKSSEQESAADGKRPTVAGRNHEPPRGLAAGEHLLDQHSQSASDVAGTDQEKGRTIIQGGAVASFAHSPCDWLRSVRRDHSIVRSLEP